MRRPSQFWSFPITALLLLLLAACTGDRPDPLTMDRPDPLTMCVQHETIRTHIHATFVPVLDRNPRQLPANIGIAADCMRPLHTHGTDFEIHIESPGEEKWTMGDFFRVWGDENPYQGLGTNSISVNGDLYEDDYSGIVLVDGIRVVIDFKSQ